MTIDFWLFVKIDCLVAYSSLSSVRLDKNISSNHWQDHLSRLQNKLLTEEIYHSSWSFTSSQESGAWPITGTSWLISGIANNVIVLAKSRFSQMHNIGNSGNIAVSVFLYISSFLLFVLVNAKFDITGNKRITFQGWTLWWSCKFQKAERKRKWQYRHSCIAETLWKPQSDCRKLQNFVCTHNNALNWVHWSFIKVSSNHLFDFFCNVNLKYEMSLTELQNANKF